MKSLNLSNRCGLFATVSKSSAFLNGKVISWIRVDGIGLYA
jgi:hypothetical protein